MKKIITCFIFLVVLSCGNSLLGQSKQSISGYLKDINSGETLIGANVYVKDDITTGTTSNVYGFYSLTLEAGEYILVAEYLGYNKKEFTVNLNQDIRQDIELSQGGIVVTQEVVVTAEEKDKNVESTEMGTVALETETLKKLPALLGEVDVLKSIQLLPGVLSAGEGNSGFYVRGGGPDQNLVTLDEAVVYNPGHLFGFFSIFNADAIKTTTLIKGSIPAHYGGRLSSVVDIQMKDGNNKHFVVEGGIGAIASRLTLQGPIVKNKGSFLISARRTYAFEVAQPAINNTDFAGTNYYFYDLNTKLNYQITDKDKLFFSGYFGRDVLNYVSKQRGFKLNMPWGNFTSTLRWNHLFSDKLFMNATAIYNEYDFTVEAEQADFVAKIFSGVKDWNGKLDFDYFASTKHHLKYGLNYTYHTFTPNSAVASASGVDFENVAVAKHAHETAAYFSDHWKVNDRFSLTSGLRFSMFTQVGPWANADSSKIYKTLEPIKRYFGLEPRLGAKYSVNQHSSIKGGVSVANQYIHLVASSTSTLPTDLWVPSSLKVKPQIGIQYAVGYFQNFAKNKYETSIEVYYKDLFNQIDYAESYVPDLTTEEEDEFVFGDGESYGVELFLKKRTGKLNGWIGYTLSRTTRSFPEIEDGRPFPAKYDRTHDLSIVANYDFSKKWSVATTFVYGTGNAYTLPESFYFIDFNVHAKYGPRNGTRQLPYHRLDLGATYSPGVNKDKAFKSTFSFSVYNVYNRKNVFLSYFAPGSGSVGGNVSLKAYRVSLFPIIPTITWNFKWQQNND